MSIFGTMGDPCIFLPPVVLYQTFSKTCLSQYLIKKTNELCSRTDCILAGECACDRCWQLKLTIGVEVTSFRLLMYGLQRPELLTVEHAADSEAINSDGRHGYFKKCSAISADETKVTYSCNCSPACDTLYIGSAEVFLDQDLQATICEISIED